MRTMTAQILSAHEVDAPTEDDPALKLLGLLIDHSQLILRTVLVSELQDAIAATGHRYAALIDAHASAPGGYERNPSESETDAADVADVLHAAAIFCEQLDMEGLIFDESAEAKRQAQAALQQMDEQARDELLCVTLGLLALSERRLHRSPDGEEQKRLADEAWSLISGPAQD